MRGERDEKVPLRERRQSREVEVVRLCASHDDDSSSCGGKDVGGNVFIWSENSTQQNSDLIWILDLISGAIPIKPEIPD